jgi:hypothetical protein
MTPQVVATAELPRSQQQEQQSQAKWGSVEPKVPSTGGARGNKANLRVSSDDYARRCDGDDGGGRGGSGDHDPPETTVALTTTVVKVATEVVVMVATAVARNWVPTIALRASPHHTRRQQGDEPHPSTPEERRAVLNEKASIRHQETRSAPYQDATSKGDADADREREQKAELGIAVTMAKQMIAG